MWHAMLFPSMQQRLIAVVLYELRSLLSLSGELILLFDPLPAQLTKFLTN
jgi:hypothetical protein